MDVGVKDDGQPQPDEEPLLARAATLLKNEGVFEFAKGAVGYVEDRLSAESDSGPTLYAHEEDYLIDMWDDRGLTIVESYLIAGKEQSHGKYGQRNIYLLKNEEH